MKKISEKQKLFNEISLLNNKIGYWSHMSHGLLITCFVLLGAWAYTAVYLADKNDEMKQTKDRWQDAYKLEHAFNINNYKEFVEMRDYAWKLEHKLAKCEGGN